MTKKRKRKMLTVGAAGIPARGTASCCNLLSFLLQCRGQECPRLLQFVLLITVYYLFLYHSFLYSTHSPSSVADVASVIFTITRSPM